VNRAVVFRQRARHTSQPCCRHGKSAPGSVQQACDKGAHAEAKDHRTRRFGHIDETGIHVPGNRPGTLESYGTTTDGRAFYVVSTSNRKFVITVIDLEEV
jgi:hypothetical protein